MCWSPRPSSPVARPCGSPVISEPPHRVDVVGTKVLMPMKISAAKWAFAGVRSLRVICGVQRPSNCFHLPLSIDRHVHPLTAQTLPVGGVPGTVWLLPVGRTGQPGPAPSSSAERSEEGLREASSSRAVQVLLAYPIDDQATPTEVLGA